MEDTLTPPPVRRNGVEVLEGIESVKDISRLLKGLEPYKTQGPDEVSPYVLRERAGTLDRLLEMLSTKNLWKRV